mgnify:CR=1 FL=1
MIMTMMMMIMSSIDYHYNDESKKIIFHNILNISWDLDEYIFLIKEGNESKSIILTNNQVEILASFLKHFYNA